MLVVPQVGELGVAVGVLERPVGRGDNVRGRGVPCLLVLLMLVFPRDALGGKVVRLGLVDEDGLGVRVVEDRVGDQAAGVDGLAADARDGLAVAAIERVPADFESGESGIFKVSTWRHDGRAKDVDATDAVGESPWS